MKKYGLTALLIALGLSFLVSGCAGYGKLKYAAPSSSAVTIQDLEKQSQDYEVYYSGRRDDPSAILFVRKGDDRSLVPSDRWSKVKDTKMVTGLMEALKSQPATGEHYPRLWLVLGPDNHVYGYMFTAWNRAVLKVIDQKSLFVYDMPLPPYRAFIGRERD